MVPYRPPGTRPTARHARRMDQTSSELPAYSPTHSPTVPPREPVVHKYSLQNKNGKPWFTLEVSSKAPSPEKIPLIIEGEPVTGLVSLDLDSETRMKSVVVSVLGELITEAERRYTFVERTITLWSQDAANGSGEASTSRKGRLQGRHLWPFTLSLPSEVELVNNDNKSTTYHLPATFFVRWTRATINYRIVANITHGLFHPDHVVGTNAFYMPITRPGPASMARRIAYQEHSPLVGPDGDPQGWRTLEPVTVVGTVFNTRAVRVQYTLSLANPLSYTRGSVIPLHLTIQCEDMHALDLLSDPQTLDVWLRWTLSMQYDQGGTSFAPMGTQAANKNLSLQEDARRVPDLPYKAQSFRVQRATWWALPAYDKTTSDKRELQGEIHIAPTIHPTTHLGRFHFWHTISMYAPKTAGFSPERTGKIQTVNVDICTRYAEGPRPVAYSPPKYDELFQDLDDDQERTRHNTFSPDSGFM